jgi:3-oxoacyl-[acyl-carrier protein] reductase
MDNKNILIFGATGAIGSALVDKYTDLGWNVFAISRSRNIIWDTNNTSELPDELDALKSGEINAAVWAQGMNLNDSIYNYSSDSSKKMYASNVEYIALTLSKLLEKNKISKGAKLCVISSIWQDISRNNKFTYSVTKSALKGLVNSLSNDLAKDNILVNAVLPGAIDTAMTRANISEDIIKEFEDSTEFGRLASLEDVVNTVCFLCSENNTGVTGNFIKVDLGFSHVRNY